MTKQKFEIVGRDYYLRPIDYVHGDPDGALYAVDDWVSDEEDEVFASFSDRAEAVSEFFRCYQPEELTSDSCRVYELQELSDDSEYTVIAETDFPKIEPFINAQFWEDAQKYEPVASKIIAELDATKNLDGYHRLKLVECVSDAFDELHDDTHDYVCAIVKFNHLGYPRWECLEEDETLLTESLYVLNKSTSYLEFVKAVYYAYTASRK